MFARGIEVIQAIDDALAVIDADLPPPAANDAAAPRAGVGHAATEAPRGILYVSLETDAAGDVQRLRIVPPTSQNQAQIEADLRALAPRILADPRRRGPPPRRSRDPRLRPVHLVRDALPHRHGGTPGAAVRVHVIGIGTARADDAAGLAVAELLASRPLPDGVVVMRCARPLPDLLDALDGADAAVLVDAARTGGAPGAIRRLAPDDLARLRSPSSHGLGVAQALALANALGRAPARVAVVAIEAEQMACDALSPAVAAAIAAAADAALRIARELQSGGEVARDA